jgi:hypothetical protein
MGHRSCSDEGRFDDVLRCLRQCRRYKRRAELEEPRIHCSERNRSALSKLERRKEKRWKEQRSIPSVFSAGGTLEDGYEQERLRGARC